MHPGCTVKQQSYPLALSVILIERLFGQKPSAVSRGRSLKELAKLAIKKRKVLHGCGCFHEASD